MADYVVWYCEAWNLESLEAVVEAAEDMRSLVIAGFNGGFLTHPAREKPANLTYYAGHGSGPLKRQGVSSISLERNRRLSQIEEGIHLGFNSVMVGTSTCRPRRIDYW